MEKYEYLISGERFHQLADITILTRHQLFYIQQYRYFKVNDIFIIDFDNITEECIETISKYSKIFIFGDQLYTFLINVAPRLKNNFILISHNSDINLDDKYIPLIEKLDKLIKVYSQNVSLSSPYIHEKIECLPIAIANSLWSHGNFEIFKKVLKENNVKSELCFFGFNFETNRKVRLDVFNKLQNKFPWKNPNETFENYIRLLSSYKYCICPEGNGVDSHRFWECIYLGIVPIIKKNNWSTNFLGKVPMIVLENWEDLTQEYLEKEYENFKEYFSTQTPSPESSSVQVPESSVQVPDVANYNYYVQLIKNDLIIYEKI